MPGSLETKCSLFFGQGVCVEAAQVVLALAIVGHEEPQEWQPYTEKLKGELLTLGRCEGGVHTCTASSVLTYG